MSVKIGLIKVSADGEQLSVEYNLEKRDFDQLITKVIHEAGKPPRIEPGVSLRQLLDPYFRLMDDRLLEMNLRIIASNRLVKALPVEAQMAVNNVMDVLHGRASGPAGQRAVQEAEADYQKAMRDAAEKQAEIERLVAADGGVPEPGETGVPDTQPTTDAPV